MAAKKNSRKAQKARPTTNKKQSTAKVSPTVSVAQSTTKVNPATNTALALPKTKPPVRKFTVLRKRGWLLTTWLLLAICFSIFIMYVLLLDIIRATSLHDPNFQSWRLIVAMLLEAMIMVGAIALLNWKKWGFYLYVAVGCCSIIFNFSLGQAFAQTFFFPIMSIAIISSMIFSKGRWKMFA